MQPKEVRKRLVEALDLDLVGPGKGSALESEVVTQSPSRWYITGFLMPLEAEAANDEKEMAEEGIDQLREAGGIDDAVPPEPAAARRGRFPSSMGLSVLVGPETRRLEVTARWGDYLPEKAETGDPAGIGAPAAWRRAQREATLALDVPSTGGNIQDREIPDTGGLRLAISARNVGNAGGGDGGMPAGTRAVSVFLVNGRRPAPDLLRDQAFIFQAELELACADGFIPRSDPRGLGSADWDERVADLHYRDTGEFASGHNVAARFLVEPDGRCLRIQSTWIPRAEVERVAPEEVPGVELSMESLGQISSAGEAREKLESLAGAYRAWIESQKRVVPAAPKRRAETGAELIRRAEVAAARIADGIALLEDPLVLEAFRIANRAMGRAARQRISRLLGESPAEVEPPRWLTFQLAFILMNLRGLAEPVHRDREIVDLLFFPTGGGKTEAYLGLAAFAIVLRRLRHDGILSAGVSVLMRYTLRLLTLDQLSRAAALICALELERERDPARLGHWPFEIGLWVGLASTPNRMGRKGDNDQRSARAKTIAFLNDSRKPAPIPLEECPWCGKKFSQNSFRLAPNPDEPADLRVHCVDRRCEFSGERPLPILGVDEPIYRRLPCFLIATVDKFAAMPWTGEVGSFFGRAERHDREGFYGPSQPGQGRPIPGRLPPPDLVIQDELHLISGPMGTLVGLYETALDELCCREVDGKKIRPKVVASTATVRRAENQVRALFGRRVVDIFPPPGPDRRNSFFARIQPPDESNARLYAGIAAQGRSPKVILLRTYLALLGAAQKTYLEAGGKRNKDNPADPYMTLLGYFNSLRELGGSRRIVEDEVATRLAGYGRRRRAGEEAGLFADRKILFDVIELTSRVSTDRVADAKRRLACPFHEDDRVDVALATNMISVGLDIQRLGLMAVFGQPKTSAEYIQATSRVGRDPERPGLVLTLLNIHKPRDRSHYERFEMYHRTFYRSVEATSVTPFSPRALDHGLAGTLVALVRHGHAPMTPAAEAGAILEERGRLDFAARSLADRGRAHADLSEEEAEKLERRLKDRARDLLDEWSQIAEEYRQAGVRLQYGTEVSPARRLLYEFLNPELADLPLRHRKFCANRSMRDIEPNVNLWARTLDGYEIEEDEES
ncbi:MAG: helicase [Planctomycetes bacterium]|nr:helicase [Planctomycetota bacterium]